MKVLIDADGCPVTDIAVRLCRKHAIQCLILCDTSHELHYPGIQTLVFDKGTDSVDFALVNRIAAGDVVITQDYGLASMCLSRNARVLHQDGWEYTTDNIDALLLLRHSSFKARSAGKRHYGSKKRTQDQNAAFEELLSRILQTTFHG